jgi:hypothetical protein
LVVFLPFFIAITQSPPFMGDNVWALKMVVNDILKIARGIFGTRGEKKFKPRRREGSRREREGRIWISISPFAQLRGTSRSFAPSRVILLSSRIDSSYDVSRGTK